MGTVLNKPIGPESDYAESWEIVDHGSDQSVVRNGELRGRTLHQLVEQYPVELLGKHAAARSFPLLFKFLDAHDNLSVQVHPNDEQAQCRNVPDLGKTEAWVVLDAAPGSVVYAGLKRGFDRPALERELHRGTLELCLHRFEVQPGDCIFVPAGTVHAIGKGLLIAEIQQASDVTFRLYDWNRRGPDGKSRELHLAEGLDAIDFQMGHRSPQVPQATDVAERTRLVECDKFVLDRWSIRERVTLGGDDRCHLVAVLSGRVRLEGAPNIELSLGQTALLPASAEIVAATLFEPSTILDGYMP